MRHPLTVRALASALVLASALPAAFAGPEPAPCAAPAPVQGQAEVDRLIAEGRKLLDLRRASEAEGLFLQAAELDGHTLKSEMWVLRARMDQGGHSNDVLDAISDLARTNQGPTIDYLLGMAYARRAEEQIQQGTFNAVDMNLQDAVQFLSDATAAEPDLFPDAYLALARAAWYRTDLPRARAAAEQAQRRSPESAEAAFELGRIALSQFQAAQSSADEVEQGTADPHWNVARDAFRRAVELCGEPRKDDARGASLLGQASLQLGHTLMWKQSVEEARGAYARALEWAPEAVDVGQLYNVLDAATLLAVLEQAAPRFEARFGKGDARDAGALWWLGYARYAANKPAEAEQAFLAALQKAPAYANAWFYVAMTRYDRKDFIGAADALVRGFAVDPVAIVNETRGNADLNTAKIEYMIGPLVQAARYADAAILAEICAEAAQDEPKHWNNLAFFLREEGARLAQVKDDAERARALPTFERSLEAYERALALAPEDPTYLNDTAVVLHYYLGRDLDRAMALYEQAARIASARLEQRTGMLPETRELVQTALRDATNNKRALEKLLAERAKAARPAEAGSGESGGG